MMNIYIHLHVHTEYSPFDGCITVEALFQKAKMMGMDAIAVTDHHTLFSWFRMKECEKKYGVKALYGAELNVGNHHLTAIALNEKGLYNLSILNNLGYAKKTRAKISEQELKQYKEGIYFLSGCSKGKIPSLLMKREFKKAYDTVLDYKKLFSSNFALEVQNYGNVNNQTMIRAFISLGIKTGVEVIPTNDCHYLNREDHSFHSDYLQMKTLGKIKQYNTQNYVKTQEEMTKYFPDFMLMQTKMVAQKSQVDFTHYLRHLRGNSELPLSMIYYYDDAEALRKILYSKKKYKLGQFMYHKMKKEDLKLEDIYLSEELRDILPFAFQLRGKLYKIEADPYYYLKTSDSFPLFRSSKEQPLSAQIDSITARTLDMPVYDRRKIEHYA